ncbi:transporter substrate-binding domain-containing protein [Paraburkholderia solisilvae]|uniref:Membrane-bound lytic murein transglycosylase F n=1 Tax=Paraburkholderia solisilvae TaxID=624376 RepID=A0A6J5E880_9BURK|nr:transporter substrate-binding domain-containing protein [Paraburkholderia solisilvae]CAB3761804.1 Membrane-bound lytic murein transglycosylase F [Paraburkholderia solisilvae]
MNMAIVPARIARRAWRLHDRGTAACMLLTVALAGALGPAHAATAHAAADRLDLIRQRGVLVVGVKTDYPPFGMLARDATQQGFEHDLAADLARRLGVQLRTVGVTGANRLQALDENRVDATIATLGDTAERRQIETLVEPDYYTSGVTLMTRPDNTLTDWADIRGKTVCATQGSYFNRTMATRYLLNLQTYANGRDAKLAVRDRRCVGWLFDSTAIAGDLLSSEWRDYRIPLPPQLLTPWAIAIARDAKGSAFERFIGDTVADWHRQGMLIALERKWGLPPSAFLADMHTLWGRRDPDGQYVCRRLPDGQWPVACRNPIFVASTDVTGLRRWGLRVFERTGINLTYVYDDYERGQFLHALWLTLALTVCCVAGSALCGLAGVWLAARGGARCGTLMRRAALAARMTPPLLQIYLLMFGLGSIAAMHWGIRFNAFAIVVLSLSVYTGAGLMHTLDHAAREETERMADFVVDGASLRYLVHRSSASITASLVNVTKATVMASTVAVPELLSVSTSIIAEHGNVATMMNTLMLFFLLLVFVVLRLIRWAIRRLCDARA